MGVAEVIAAVLQRFSHTHVLCYTEVWGAEIGQAVAGPAGPAPSALIKFRMTVNTLALGLFVLYESCRRLTAGLRGCAYY